MSLRRLAPQAAEIAAESLVAGIGPGLPPFAPETEAFGAALSERLLNHDAARAFPDLAALAFWLRPASTRVLRRHFAGLGRRRPRGLALHVAPANVETLFVYSWWLSALCGNANLVRVSGRAGARSALLLALLDELLARPDFARLRAANAFIAFDHDASGVAAILSAAARLRVVWGGDATIAAFASLPLADGGAEITFPDRRSAATMVARAYLAQPPAERSELARRVFNDCYWFDQKACSSPLLLAWVGSAAEAEAAGADFWPRLAEQVARHGYATALATTLAQLTEAARLALDGTARRIRRFGPGLMVVAVAAAPPRLATCGGGLFEETRLDAATDLPILADARLQTLTWFGLDAATLAALPPLLAPTGGGERLAPVGTALDFSHVWDGKDLLAAMSQAET